MDKVLKQWKGVIDKVSAIPGTEQEWCITDLAWRIVNLRAREKKQRKAYAKRIDFYVDQVNDMAEREMTALNKAEEYRTQAQPKLAELTKLIDRQDKTQKCLRGELEFLMAQRRSVVDAWKWIGWTSDETVVVNKEWHEELGRTISATFKEVRNEP